MSASQYDVVIVGAGCAGLTAALGLAQSGFAVAVVEAAPLIGGAGMLGGVCFAENLVQPELLGADGVEALAWERRLIERGRFATDGRRVAGTIYRDAEAFRHCYTVLRPLFDPHLAQIARQRGVALLTGTTVESLIREGRRIIGVATNRGPLYGDLIFLAEGDAGHLVSREGLDRSSDRRDNPAFLYCLQQVIELPPGVIEESFHVGPEQGVVYDFLLRNPRGSLLNARGQLCSNRQGLTLSVFLPAEHLAHGFAGEPRQLLDWFVDMPALRPWLRDGRRGAWTASLLRTGGLRDVPYLVEDGLVVGGAAAGLGVDFPVLNLTGPATATGLLISRAAARIRAEGRSFDRDALVRHYLEPLQQTRYWRDREFLNRWPNHVRRTSVLFDHGVDLLLASASVWSRSGRWLPWKLFGWLRVLAQVSWGRWDELREEFVQFGHALRFREVMPKPALARVVLDGALNAFRDLVWRPRPHLPAHGTLRLHYHAAGEEVRASAVPRPFRRWFERIRPVAASVGHELHSNDDTPVSGKLTRTLELLIRQVNLIDLVAAAGFAFVIVCLSTLLAAGGRLFRRLRRRTAVKDVVGWAESARPTTPPDGEIHDPHPPATAPSIHLLWRSTQPQQQAAAVRELPHICPTRVFAVEGVPPQTVRPVVRAERCIYCEACWRTNPVVDWGRRGPPPLLPAVLSPVVTRLLQAEDRAGLAEPAAPRNLDPWDRSAVLPLSAAVREELAAVFEQLERKLRSFDRALAEGPAAVGRTHNDYLEMLARYAHQLTIRIREVLQENATTKAACRRALELADALAALAEQRTRRTWDGRFAWAAADGSLLRQHHLMGLRRLLGLKEMPEQPQAGQVVVRTDWLPSHLAPHALTATEKHLLAGIAARRHLLETLQEMTIPPAEEGQAELLAALVAEVRVDLFAQTAEWNAAGLAAFGPVQDASPSAVAEAYRQLGSRFVVDVERLCILLDVPGDWATLTQRHVLRAERQEILEAEKRLLALAADWREAHQGAADDDDVRAGFVQQAAHGLAGKLLLLRTFTRLEEGADSELAIVLLRVWLDYATTLLDEFTIVVRDGLNPSVRYGDRPLVEPGSGPPLRTQAEYRAAAGSYETGDFLLRSLDLRQPRLVPEMIDAEELLPPGRPAAVAADDAAKTAALSPSAREALADLPAVWNEIAGDSRDGRQQRAVKYLVETLIVEMIGHCERPPDRVLKLEIACARLVLADLQQASSALRQRQIILQALAHDVVPRWLRGGVETRAHHLERYVLELEALKADFRQRLTAVWQVFGETLGGNAEVQASCFALAEAAAWLKAADSTLGRLGWLSRLSQAEEHEDPMPQQRLGRRVLRYCYAEIRDRLFRFDEDLAALRRGYYAPHIRAVELLLSPAVERPSSPPNSEIHRPLRVLLIVEPLPAVSPQAGDGGERVLESHWTLSDADRAAVETALRLRDAAPERVTIDVVAVGPPRVGPALRELLSLGLERVHLLLQDREDATLEDAVTSLSVQLAGQGRLDLLLGGAASGNHLATLVAEALDVPAASHAAGVIVETDSTQTVVRLMNAAGHVVRERPLPALVLLEPGTSLRPFTVAGCLASLGRRVRILTS